MPLSTQAATARADELFQTQQRTRGRLDPVRRYWKGRQRLPAVIPDAAPREVREMARMARVNVCEIVVQSLVESLLVDNFRASLPEDPDVEDSPQADLSLPVWETWQANRMDKRQAAIHAAAVGYGRSYAVVVPGADRAGRRNEHPVIRGVSPRWMTAMYGDDPDWPVEALERMDPDGKRYQLYDNEAIYRFRKGSSGLEADGEPQRHGMGVAPVVRYAPETDLDEEDEPESEQVPGSSFATVDVVMGQVAPLVSLQDQIDLITFNLLVAQHYSAFRQRWVLGWTDADENKAMKAAASVLWAIPMNEDGTTRVGEFGETNLGGYIESREAALKYAATLSQTPVHELIGQMINMAADALAAAEAGRDRKVDLFKIGLGESHEQTFQLVGILRRVDIPDDSEVVWRDTSARAFAALMQALAVQVQQLGIPPEEVWDQIPGMTQQRLRRIRATAAQGDSLANLTNLLDRQAEPAGGERSTAGGLILPPGAGE